MAVITTNIIITVQLILRFFIGIRFATICPNATINAIQAALESASMQASPKITIENESIYLKNGLEQIVSFSHKRETAIIILIARYPPNGPGLSKVPITLNNE